PGGVDTWYYLASAEALRKQKRLPIRLPQYLLHDASESYPAVFPVFLALLPQEWLRRYFWLISPLIDALHLLLLYLLSYRLTNSVLASGLAGLIYAVTPQLISETRNLNGRALASLIQTLTMVCLIWTVIPSNGPARNLIGHNLDAAFAVVVVLSALMYNAHTSTTIGFIVATAVLTLVTGDWRFILAPVLGFPAAVVLSGGYYLRVLRNHLYGAQFWIRNLGLTRAHQLDDSPVLGTPRERSSARGMYATTMRARLTLAARLFGENPFILAMILTPPPVTLWGRYMYFWAVAILGWAVLTTFGGPFRILGPGLHYMKLSVFPTAYSIALTVNANERSLSTVGLAISVVASFAAIAYFYRYIALRRTEHTATTPPELMQAADYLRTLGGTRVLVFPVMYADYVSYAGRKAVVWGGHSGNLARLHEFFPVLRKPVAYFFDRYAVDYLVLDRQYALPERLQVSGCTSLLAEFGHIGVYGVSRTPPDV
ncbi:MAG: hypothetical protein JOZ39_02210, partial [Chloroflexi bacterium]|nr:hypothetical protein [Chloroflexota bacterium]